jgi:hypothetical protein
MPVKQRIGFTNWYGTHVEQKKAFTSKIAESGSIPWFVRFGNVLFEYYIDRI